MNACDDTVRCRVGVERLLEARRADKDAWCLRSLLKAHTSEQGEHGRGSVDEGYVLEIDFVVNQPTL